MINLKDGEAALKRVESTAYGKDLPESRESLRVAEQIEELKQEINALKLIQIISLKKGKQENKTQKIS